MVEQCLARDPELAGGGAPVAVISFERGTEKTTAKISLSLLPGSRNFLFPEGDRKVLRLDDTTGGSHEGDLDGLTKLADVSRPFVLQKDRFRIGAPRARFDSVAIQSLALEELGENVNILPAVTQRRDEDRWCGDSIIEILAKPALTNAAPEIMVRRGDNSDIDGSRMVRTNRANLLVLQKSKQLDLQRRVEVSDFIEKQRPPVR